MWFRSLFSARESRSRRHPSVTTRLRPESARGAAACLLAGVTLGGCTWCTSVAPPTVAEPDENAAVDEVEAARAEMLRRVGAKRQAAEDVLAGRLTLAEAAARFRAIRAEVRQRYREAVGPLPPDACDEEVFCREVIDYARDVLRDRPDEAKEALARLEQELRAHRTRLEVTTKGEKEDGR